MTGYVVHAPIKACAECLNDYDREEWQALPLVKQIGTVERRKCMGVHPLSGNCSAELSVDVAGLDRMRAFIPMDEYAELWPDSHRLETRIARLRPPTLWARIKAAWAALWA